MGKTNAVLVKAEGSAGSLSSVSPPNMELKHDRKSYRTSLVLPRRTEFKVSNHHTPQRTKVEEALVANPLVFHKPEICTKA
jgi:hypothetical protein